MYPLSGRRVLLVEDEAVIALDLAALLTELGADVVGPAHSVATALALLNAEKLDCAVLDINLDGEAVYPVARLLKARHIPFAFVTAYYGEKVEPEFQDRPILQKPVDFQDLVHALLHTCAHRDEVLGPSEEAMEKMRQPKVTTDS